MSDRELREAIGLLLDNNPLGKTLHVQRARDADEARSRLAARIEELRAEREAYLMRTAPEFDRLRAQFERAKADFETAKREFDRFVARRADWSENLLTQRSQVTRELSQARHPLLDEFRHLVHERLSELEGRVSDYIHGYAGRGVDGLPSNHPEASARLASVQSATSRLYELSTKIGALMNAPPTVSVSTQIRDLWVEHEAELGACPEWLRGFTPSSAAQEQ